MSHVVGCYWLLHLLTECVFFLRLFRDQIMSAKIWAPMSNNFNKYRIPNVSLLKLILSHLNFLKALCEAVKTKHQRKLQVYKSFAVLCKLSIFSVQQILNSKNISLNQNVVVKLNYYVNFNACKTEKNFEFYFQQKQIQCFK